VAAFDRNLYVNLAYFINFTFSYEAIYIKSSKIKDLYIYNNSVCSDLS